MPARRVESNRLTWCHRGQILNPLGGYEINEKTVSNGDHSFTAHSDGKYMYCFGNQHWGANSKEVSFNVHGIVYVSETDMPSDPIESEGTAPRHPTSEPATMC